MPLVKKVTVRFSSILLICLMLISVIPNITVSAATSWYYRTSTTGSIIYSSSAAAAWSSANGYANGVFGILANTTLSSTLEITKGRNITIELNGYVLDRGQIDNDKKIDYNVISVTEGSTLTVYGNTIVSPATTNSNTVTVWSGSSKVSKSFKTGVITGGYNAHNGGGINVEKNGTLNLYYTSVVGNRADDAWNTVGGYGGGIALKDKYAKLNMYNSNVSYNYAENGGGVYVDSDDEYGRIHLENSYITYNTATKKGGGIYADAENLKIDGNGSSTSTSNASVKYNTATSYGGGICLNKGTSVVSGLYIYRNTSSSDGGGIFMNKEKTTVKNCYISYNTSDGKGGGIYNDNDFNTLNAVRIISNKAANGGGGVFNNSMVDISLGGKCIIRSNTSTTYGTDNLYLDSTINPTQQTFYIKDSLSTGSEVHVRYSSSHPARLTYYSGTYDESFYTYDNDSTHYFKWYSGDETSPVSGEDNRNIFLVSGTKPSSQTAVELTTDSDDTSTKTVGTFNGQPLIKGVFQFPATKDDTADREGAFYYSDGYFTKTSNPTAYNTHLATMSANLALASMYSNVGNTSSTREYRDKSNNFRQLMSDIGVLDEDIYVNDFNVKQPTTSSIGCGIASKDLPDGTKLVIIGVRGAGYETEWASNVTIGSSGEASGFSSAATQVYSELNSYMKRKGIDGSKAKFWISGYSRAGATANLLAKRIVDAYDTSGVRTYAYPIEAPKGGLRSKEVSGNNYNCIHNVLNTNDIVPWVAPGEMGFIRYGVDHFVPGSSSTSTVSSYFSSYGVDQLADNSYYKVGSSTYKTQKAKMLKQLQSMNDDIVYDDYFSSATINYVTGAAFSRFDFQFVSEPGKSTYYPETWIPEFFQKFQAWGFDFFDNATSDGEITDGAKIRSNYSTTKIMSSRTSTTGKSFQQAVALLCKIVFSMSSDEQSQLMSVTDGLVDRIGISNIMKIYARYINTSFSGLAGSSDFYDDVETIWKALTELSTEDEAKGYHSLAEFLSEDDLEELHTAFPALVYPLLEFIAEDYSENSQDHAGTLADNAMRLIQNHYPEVAVSWIRSYDTYYTTTSTAYGDDTVPITLSSTYKTANKPKAPAVELNNNESSLYSSSTSNIISVKSKDEIRFVPSDVSKKNTGVAFYYQFTSGTKDNNLHAFSDPIVLGKLSTDYADDDGTYTISVYTTHYDTWYSKTAGTFKFKLLSGTASFTVPDKFDGTEYTYDTVGMNYKQTLSIDALESMHTNSSDYTWKFKEWTVEDSQGNLVANNLYKQYFGSDFDPSSPITTVANLKDEDFKFIPVFEKTLNSINIFFYKNSDSIVPVVATCSTVGSYRNPIAWRYDENSEKYIANFNITLPDNTTLADEDNLAISYNSVLGQLSNPTLTAVSVDDNIANITVEFDGPNSELLDQVSGFTVVAVDDNTQSTLKTFTFYKYGNSSLSIFAPNIESESFVKWDDDSTELSRAVTDSDVEYTAHYCPIVNELKIELDKAPTAGEEMPELKSASVNIVYDWYLNPVELSWNPTVINNTADYNTSYTATFTIDTSNLKGSLDGESWQDLSGEYKFADDLNVTISDSSGEIGGIAYTIRDENGKVYLGCTFPETASPKIETVQDVNVDVSNNTSAENILKKLPDSVNVTLSDYSVIDIPVSWDAIPDSYNPDSLDEQSFVLNGTLDTEYELAQGVEVVANVIVSSAPMTSSPNAIPESGTYYGNQDIMLTADDGADIYYAIAVMELSENDESNQPEFTSSDYKKYDGVIETNSIDEFEFGKEIIISAYATKDKMNNSSTVTFRYVINEQTTTFVPEKDAQITEDGCIEHYQTVVSGSGTDDDPYEYRYYADEAGTEELTYDEIVIPAYIKSTLTPDVEDVVASQSDDYKALDLLGVQKHSNTEKHDVRFVTVIDSRILENATDYGYVFSIVDSDTVAKAKENSSQITVENGTLRSCKNTTNNISGDYGNDVFDKNEDGYTSYKYVTATVSNLPATLDEPNGSKVVVARFYVKLEDNENYIYATYCSNYDGCAVNYYKLDHPDS